MSEQDTLSSYSENSDEEIENIEDSSLVKAMSNKCVVLYIFS